MTIEANKALVREWVRACNSGVLRRPAPLLASDSDRQDPSVEMDEPQDALEMIREFRQAASDLRIAYQDMVAEESAVMLRFTMQGTHSAVLLGIPASGRRFTVTGLGLFRISAGKIVECRILVDMLQLLKQIGPPPGLGSLQSRERELLPAST
jgi:steroid delta-isomerase-like uncharacterized protein